MNCPAGIGSEGVAESDRIHQLHRFAGFHPPVGMDVEPAAAEVGETHVGCRKGRPHTADEAGVGDGQDHATRILGGDATKGGKGAARHHIGLLGTIRPAMRVSSGSIVTLAGLPTRRRTFLIRVAALTIVAW